MLSIAFSSFALLISSFSLIICSGSIFSFILDLAVFNIIDTTKLVINNIVFVAKNGINEDRYLELPIILIALNIENIHNIVIEEAKYESETNWFPFNSGKENATIIPKKVRYAIKLNCIISSEVLKYISKFRLPILIYITRITLIATFIAWSIVIIRGLYLELAEYKVIILMIATIPNIIKSRFITIA